MLAATTLSHDALLQVLLYKRKFQDGQLALAAAEAKVKPPGNAAGASATVRARVGDIRLVPGDNAAAVRLARRSIAAAKAEVEAVRSCAQLALVSRRAASALAIGYHAAQSVGVSRAVCWWRVMFVPCEGWRIRPRMLLKVCWLGWRWTPGAACEQTSLSRSRRKGAPSPPYDG
jgi:hypothetical protein